MDYIVTVDNGTPVVGKPSDQVLALVDNLTQGSHNVTLATKAGSGVLTFENAQVIVGTGLTG